MSSFLDWSFTSICYLVHLSAISLECCFKSSNSMSPSYCASIFQFEGIAKSSHSTCNLEHNSDTYIMEALRKCSNNNDNTKIYSLRPKTIVLPPGVLCPKMFVQQLGHMSIVLIGLCILGPPIVSLVVHSYVAIWVEAENVDEEMTWCGQLSLLIKLLVVILGIITTMKDMASFRMYDVVKSHSQVACLLECVELVWAANMPLVRRIFQKWHQVHGIEVVPEYYLWRQLASCEECAA